VLAVVPGGADAEQSPAARQDVQSGQDLGQQPRVAVGDPGDQQAQLQALGLPGEKAQGGVALEHRVGGRRHVLHLEVVVHQRERGEAGLIGGAGGGGQPRPDGGGVGEGGEVGDVQGQIHGSILPIRHRAGSTCTTLVPTKDTSAQFVRL